MKNLILILSFGYALSLNAQGKRFSVQTNLAFSRYDKDYKLDYSSWSFRIQYNLPKYFSFNLGYGQEHQSFTNVSMQDLPPGYYVTSDVRTTENFIPLTFRFTVGKKIQLYTEVGAQFNFFGSAKVDAFVDYWSNLDQQDYNYSYTETLDNPYAYYENERVYNFIKPIFGGGLIFPIYKGINVYAEYRRMFFLEDEYYVTDDHFAPFMISPYSRGRISIGLTYNFNMKKSSDFIFKTFYYKLEKNN